MLDRRLAARSKKARHDFPFSGLITCGHCGCALVGETKKSRYVYYHCTGYKGKCPERYTRQEVFEREFSRLLAKIDIDEEVISWVAEALRQSHADEQRFHSEAITRLTADHERLHNRLNVLYEDRLDGRIDVKLFDRKSREFGTEQSRILQSIQSHQTAERSYMEDGIRLLELSRHAHTLFERQPAAEKRRLLNFVLSNCCWKDGKLIAVFKEPFDMLVLANESAGAQAEKRSSRKATFEDWLPKNTVFQLFLHFVLVTWPVRHVTYSANRAETLTLRRFGAMTHACVWKRNSSG